MSDHVNAYFKRFYPSAEQLAHCETRYAYVGFVREVAGFPDIFPEMVMADGLRLSVQGHCGAYSHPRDDFADEYITVEIMGPKQADELLSPYERECNSVGDQMIYPYVPVHVVNELIEKHGGLME